MKKSGGIIAIIAGVLGVIAAFITLFIGGLGSAFNADGGQTVVGLGWLGILASILVIVFGSITLSAVKKTSSVLLILTSVFGAVAGGTLVAIFMALSFIGGLLAYFGTSAQIDTAQTSATTDLKPSSNNSSKTKKIIFSVLGILIIVLILGVIGSKSGTSNKLDEYAELERQTASTIQPFGELHSIFELGGNATDLQRENKIAEISGKIVEWTLEVFEVRKEGDFYKIQTASEGNVSTFTYIKPRNEEEIAFIESLKTGSIVSIKGVIKDTFLRHIVIKPAVFAIKKVQPEVSETTEDLNRDADSAPNDIDAESITDVESNTPTSNYEVLAPLPESSIENQPPTLTTTKIDNEEMKIEPSFDCSKAQTNVEKMICSNASLARLDKELSLSYQQSIKLIPENKKSEAIEAQRAWLKTRINCADVVCLTNLYTERDKELAPWNHEAHD